LVEGAFGRQRAGKQMDIDVNELRRALGCFVTGVTVVTTVAADGEPRGFTANSFTSVSLDPPLVLACIARRAGSFDVFRNARAFAINILQEDQRDLSATFASSRPDKFAGLQWTTSKTGSPLLPVCSAWLDCEMHEQIEAGDHVILIGRVVDFAHSPRTPLGYYSGSYVGFGMERRAVEGLTADRQVVVGGIFEKDGDVLLLKRDGEFHLPESHRLGSEDDRSSGLFAELAKIGVRADLNFVYAVFQDQGSGLLHVFYRGEIIEGPAPGSAAQLVPLERIAEQPIASLTAQHMLRRYAREQLSSGFGIYVGDSTRGIVQTLAGPPSSPPNGTQSPRSRR
jgi:flavin reductase (DIM6/NTAB) family NADH-FMN oxidoreductase RutF